MPKQQQQLRRSSRLSAKSAKKPQTEQNSRIKEKTGVKLGPKKTRPKDKILSEDPVENSAETEAQRQAFGNYLVIYNILSKLRTCDLITIRLVNSSWKETANSILLRRQNLKAIDIRFIKQVGKFLFNSLNHRKLDDLQNVLENSTNFPCTDFRIEGPLDHPNLQKFLSAYGSQIKKLHLNFTTLYSMAYPWVKEMKSYEDLVKCDRTALKVIPYFRKLLTEQAVNVDSLILHKIRFDHRDNLENDFIPIFLSPVILPNLKYVEIQKYSRKWRGTSLGLISEYEDEWTQGLLSAAPNLQSFYTSSMKMDLMSLLTELGKCHVLTETTIDLLSSTFQNDPPLSQFNRITALKANRETEWDYPKQSDTQDFLRRSISRVLNLHVNTLTSISMELCDVIFCFSTTNVFHHVKKLSVIGFDQTEDNNQGRRKISLQHVFPHVESIRIQGETETRNRQTEEDFPFLTNEPINTVKTMEVAHICPYSWLEFLPQMFPQVVHLILENYWNLPEDGHLFWAFSTVQFVDLGTLIGVDNLDSVFTEFSENTCKRLREKSEQALVQLLESKSMDIETKAEVEELREYPSIVDRLDVSSNVNLCLWNDAVPATS